MEEPSKYTCAKCGVSFPYKYLERKALSFCPNCGEPVLASVLSSKTTKLTDLKEKRMPFQMNFSKESLSGAAPVQDGWYDLLFGGFKPTIAGQNKDSVNLNPQLSITNNSNSELDGRRIFENLNTKGSWVIQDFVHACGLLMEPVLGPNGEPESYTIPGIFKGMDTDPDDPSKWEYLGPLQNKILQVEIYTSEYNGKKSNKIKQYRCAVPNCNERHSTNLGR